MKHLIKILFFTMMLVFFVPRVSGQGTTPHHGTLTKKDRDVNNEPAKGQRTPSLPIAYSISEEEGLQIMSSSISTSDIIEFEIWDAEGELCQEVFANEADFIATLFSMQGDFQIRFITDEYSLIGYISL